MWKSQDDQSGLCDDSVLTLSNGTSLRFLGFTEDILLTKAVFAIDYLHSFTDLLLSLLPTIRPLYSELFQYECIHPFHFRSSTSNRLQC
ncbi:hypothetical protein TNCV_1225061 [Trichonephila clavipes]|nr:hypothetical protein TNCV_1225061 [Trichonephila clavipes]